MKIGVYIWFKDLFKAISFCINRRSFSCTYWSNSDSIPLSFDCSIYCSHTVLPKIAPFSPGSDAFYPGDYFSLQCSIIHGDLPMSIYWQFENQTISKSNGEIMISHTGTRSSVLTIESVRDHHAGNYTCYGKNVAGISNHTVPLIVNGLSTNTSIRHTFGFRVS